ncbi:MAG: radical SAM protein [Deltaproteobacteria bacterium]|nr:radical SAM protein [Deltaproteobacteria bacterium]
MKGARHHKTLAVETGILCNNRCVFCYQQGYRSIRDYPQMVPQDEIRQKLLWGLENGYDELSLTGGEPTARPDFLQLVREARQLGYRRVAVTTNGWKLSRPGFFREAVDAGLTSMGVSIHGLDAATHEALTGHRGSFRKAIQAVRNAVRTAGTYHLVRLNTFTLVNRLNHDHLTAMAEMLHGIGVRLMIFQPVILSKSNFDAAGDLSLGLQDVVAAVRGVAAAGVEKGFRTKLFNLPPCLFRDVLKGIDLDHYERVTFRENDDYSPGSRSLGDEAGFVRLTSCVRCVFLRSCPGLHVTLLPQKDLVVQVEEAITSQNPSNRQRLWLAGTDLLRPRSLYSAVRKARMEGYSDVKVTFGGSSLGGLAGLRAAVEGGASELVLVHHLRDRRSSDRILGHSGNAGFLAKVADSVSDLPRGHTAPVGVLVTPVKEALEFLGSDALAPIGRLSPILYLRAPWRSTATRDDMFGAFREFLDGLYDLPFNPGGLVMEVPWPRVWEMATALPLAALAARGRVRFDLTGFVLQSSLLDPQYSVLNWSVPFIGGRELDLRLPGSGTFYSRAVSVKPVDMRLIRSSQTPYGGPPDP